LDGGAVVAHGIFGAAVVTGHETVEGDGDVDESLAHYLIFSKDISGAVAGQYPGATFNGGGCDKNTDLSHS